jgi:hypothetical protein
VLRREAENVWRNWNPLIWGIIKYRGCFGEPASVSALAELDRAPPRRRFLRRLLPLRR